MDIFKLFGTIAINNSGANKAIGETSALASSLSKTFSAVGSAALKVGAVAGTAFSAASAGVGVLMKKSIASYSEYEQLEGGVKKLFGDSSDTMMKYAQEAYKTAGMSANQYMSQATSFAASLIQSVGGDTAKAADVANMAMQDMADNANTFGTDMQSIQNAYQGFSKQNYTMLDNLKLGYGGTRSEMQRLLKDAQKIQKQNGVNVKYNIKNLDDVYEAIHVIQEANNIAGTTAAEAAETIAGSWSSASAAWDNLLVGMADGTQDMDLLIGNFATSAGNVIRNVAKILPNIAKGLTQVIEGLIPELPGMVETLLPSVIEGAVSLISGLVSILPSLLASIGTAISTAWTNTVWPMIQDLFMAKFGIELPAWEDVGETIKTWWTDDVWPNVQEFCSIKFGFDLGEWDEEVERVRGNIASFVADAQTLFERIKEWAEGDGAPTLESLKKIGEAFLWIAGTVFAVTHPVLALGLALLGIVANWEETKAAAESAEGATRKTFSDVERWANEKWTSAKSYIDASFLSLTQFLGVQMPRNYSLTEEIGKAWDTVTEKINNALGALKTFIGYGNVDTSFENAKELVEDGAFKEKVDALFGWGGNGSDKKSSRPGTADTELMIYNANAKGAVFSKPTIFDTRLGYQMVGEAGAEAVAPIDVLQGYVAAAVASQNAGIANALERVVEAIESMDANMGGHMRDALEDTSLKVNNREFARMVKAVG